MRCEGEAVRQSAPAAIMPSEAEALPDAYHLKRDGARLND
jgi:hypothetical protein